MPALSMIGATYGYGRPQRGTNPYVNDKIYASLTTNQSTYSNAALNTWVPVTSAEYLSLSNNVTGTAEAATTLANFNAIGTFFATANTGIFGKNDNQANAEQPSIQQNHYIYAFAIKLNAAGNIRVLANPSSSAQTGFSNVDGQISASSGTNYFVYKGQNTIYTPAAAGSLGFWYDGSSANVGFATVPANVGGASWITPQSTVPTTATSIGNSDTKSRFAIQALTSATKQWVV